MSKLEINPPIKSFVVFSGGGGLITREETLRLQAGKNQIVIREVPASFDPETFVAEFESKKVKLQEFVIKKPNRQYVDDNLRREGECAQRLINESVELGEQRRDILEICEAVSLRTYIDEEVYLVIWVEVPDSTESKLILSYFVDDVRFRWKPTIIAELDEDQQQCHVRGFIAITNESAKRLDEVEVSFADFAKDMSEDATGLRLEPKEFKVEMKKQRMKMMQIK
jgi:hypothetical protein